MATLKLRMDQCRLRKDGTAPIVIAVSHCRKTYKVGTGVALLPSQFDGARVVNHPSARVFNLKLSRQLVDAQQAVFDIERREKPYTASEVAAAVSAAVNPCKAKRLEEPAPPKVMDSVRAYALMKRERSTRETYERLAKHLEKYDPNAELGAVGRAWLEGFDAHMSATAPSPNSRAIMMRCLRAVFNYAIDEGLVANYPFRKYKIKTVATPKRSLDAEDLRRLLTMEVELWQEPYRDFFALSFYLLGANPKDILHLPAGAADSGRVTFNRAKTGKLYDIKVQPEAAAIIGRMRGKAHMLDVMDSRSDYLQFVRQANHALQTLGTEGGNGRKRVGAALWPGISMYWARHSWATIAAELDIPDAVISQALGHSSENSTTAIYIRRNVKKVDEANRRVIDFVLFGER